MTCDSKSVKLYRELNGQWGNKIGTVKKPIWNVWFRLNRKLFHFIEFCAGGGETKDLTSLAEFIDETGFFQGPVQK